MLSVLRQGNATSVPSMESNNPWSPAVRASTILRLARAAPVLPGRAETILSCAAVDLTRVDRVVAGTAASAAVVLTRCTFSQAGLGIAFALASISGARVDGLVANTGAWAAVVGASRAMAQLSVMLIDTTASVLIASTRLLAAGTSY
jgi:hypothetical protein